MAEETVEYEQASAIDYLRAYLIDETENPDPKIVLTLIHEWLVELMKNEKLV